MWNKEKCFLFHFESSFRSWDNQILTFHDVMTSSSAQAWNTKRVLLNNFFFFNLDSFHARLNSRYKAWSYKKKEHKRIKAYRKSGLKEPTVKRCLLILDFKLFRS